MKNTSTKLDRNTVLTIKAANHFEIDENEVEQKHLDFIRGQEYALNHGFMGTPLRSYTLDESGVVVFDRASSEALVNQYDLRTNSPYGEI